MTQLYAFEQELARRTGPYLAENAVSGNATSVVLASLQSTLGLGDQWSGATFLLRRGFLNNAPPVVSPYTTADRLRRVSAVDFSTGRVTVDRAWTNAPVAGETVELVYLDPTNELRPATLAGLKRCYIVDRATLATTGIAPERDVTVLACWITQPNQIFEVYWNYPSALYVSRPVAWFNPIQLLGHVWLQVAPDPFPNNLIVYARRPLDTIVNGLTACGGPTADGDDMPIVLEYGAAWAHVEAWHLFPDRLLPAAQAGIKPSLEMAKSEAERQAKANYAPMTTRDLMGSPFPVNSGQGV